MERARLLMAMANHTSDEMEGALGLGGLTVMPRIAIPPPSPVIATKGQMIFHNINVSGSVVGAINTGEVQRIDVAIDHIKMTGGAELADSLKHFTESVLASNELSQKKEEVLEQLSFLSDQTLTSKEQRKPGMIRSVLSSIGVAVSASTELVSLWQHLHPLLSRAL